MLAVIQRVSRAKVKIKGKVISQVGPGFLVLLGVIQGDNDQDCEYLIKKVSRLRVMADQDQKMNLPLQQAGGEVLVVSQFTLAADVKKGNRPSFIKAAKPEIAKKYYQGFISGLRNQGLTVATGRFGQYMQIELVNDGPVTIIIDSKNKVDT